MDGRYPPSQTDAPAEEHTPGLEQLALTVRGVAQLLGAVAQSSGMPSTVRPGLELLVQSLRQCADQADQLLADTHIDISSNLGITTTDLANMRFSPLQPPYRRTPETLTLWKKASEAEFELWGEVEAILSEDDGALERRFLAGPDDHLSLVEQLEKQRERWLNDMKLLEATLLRLAVAVARWEQNDGS
jgi:hypothetical protein